MVRKFIKKNALIVAVIAMSVIVLIVIVRNVKKLLNNYFLTSTFLIETWNHSGRYFELYFIISPNDSSIIIVSA